VPAEDGTPSRVVHLAEEATVTVHAPPSRPS
jgi:hypothetical protein